MERERDVPWSIERARSFSPHGDRERDIPWSIEREKACVKERESERKTRTDDKR
jgi:hypothetical protein